MTAPAAASDCYSGYNSPHARSITIVTSTYRYKRPPRKRKPQQTSRRRLSGRRGVPGDEARDRRRSPENLIQINAVAAHPWPDGNGQRGMSGPAAWIMRSATALFSMAVAGGLIWRLLELTDTDHRKWSIKSWTFVVGLAVLSVLLLMLTTVLLIDGPVSIIMRE